MSSGGQPGLRVGLVGCGRMSKSHFDALGRVDGLNLAAGADIDFARAEQAGKEQGVPAFRSLDELLAQANLDVVAICTPSGLHAAQGVAVARAGKHVVTEKPMAISLAQADELIRATDDAGVQLF